MCAALGHATSTQRSVDARWKGKPEPTHERTNPFTGTQQSVFNHSCSVCNSTHVGRSKTPQPKSLGPGPRRRRPLGGDDPRPGIQRRGTPPRLAGGKPARPPGWGPDRRSEPRWFTSALPRRPSPGPHEPGYWRPRFFDQEQPSNWQPPPCRTKAIGRVSRRRGEALPSRRSRCPAGTGKSGGMRGGLVGLSPEALCGEAPKGQPLIRRESLVTVRVEDPQGQPMIHGCRRQHKPRPSGKPKGKGCQVAHRCHGGQKRQEKTWGPLSRTAAWKAGCFWEDRTSKLPPKMVLTSPPRKKRSMS